MSRRTRRWMRLARLLVACVAFFVARPAVAMPSVDAVVLVSEHLAPCEARSLDTNETRRSDPKATPRLAHASQALGLLRSAMLARAPATGTPLVLGPAKYLRHCSLLR